MSLNSNIVKWVRYTQFPIAIIIYMLAALVPNPQVLAQVNVSDLVLHALGNFLLLASSWLCVLGRSRPLLWAFVIALPFSFFVEASQALTETRTPDYRDLIANFAGICLGIIVCAGAQKLIKKDTARFPVEQDFH